MRTEIPYTIQIIQALAVPAIALLASVIGALQWYTAHRKTILDLFDRRMDVYNAIRQVITKVNTSGRCDDATLFEFDQAIDRAPFLFGKDVTQYLTKMRTQLIELNLCVSMMETPQRQAFIPRKTTAFTKITAFYSDFPPIVEPYILMDQKVFRFRVFK
jgi:hypothetical protein